MDSSDPKTFAGDWRGIRDEDLRSPGTAGVVRQTGLRGEQVGRRKPDVSSIRVYQGGAPVEIAAIDLSRATKEQTAAAWQAVERAGLEPGNDRANMVYFNELRRLMDEAAAQAAPAPVAAWPPNAPAPAPAVGYAPAYAGQVLQAPVLSPQDLAAALGRTQAPAAPGAPPAAPRPAKPRAPEPGCLVTFHRRDGRQGCHYHHVAISGNSVVLIRNLAWKGAFYEPTAAAGDMVLEIEGYPYQLLVSSFDQSFEAVGYAFNILVARGKVPKGQGLDAAAQLHEEQAVEAEEYEADEDEDDGELVDLFRGASGGFQP